jgi:glutathionylspermidine synthase
MERLSVSPRPDWQSQCEAIGFNYHSMDGVYWDESHCYRFSSAQIDELDDAAATLHELCLAAVEQIVRERRFEELRIPAAYHDYIVRSWQAREPSVFGRFDFAYDGRNPPKLLEYNADTPTALLEASVAQWDWLEQSVMPGQPNADQFNSIHEKLIARWKALHESSLRGRFLHFTCLEHSDEDFGNVEYLRDTAQQAGFDTAFIYVGDIGWASDARVFVDEQMGRIEALAKLYPWEWMTRDEFGLNLKNTELRIVEPAWKMLLSNKGLLPILWELNPNHPNLLPASFDRWRLVKEGVGDFVSKPLYSREGENVTIYRGDEVIREEGTYGDEGLVYQAYTPIPRFDDAYTTIGAWIIGDESAGIGIREDESPITKNTSRFVPHYFV